MKKKCISCKTVIECNEYDTGDRNWSGIVGKYLAHYQMVHGAPAEIVFFKWFGVDPREIGLKL